MRCYYLSMHNFGHARYYLLSTQHNLGAMRELFVQGAQALGSRLVCSCRRWRNNA